METEEIVMVGVEEYAEGMPVYLTVAQGHYEYGVAPEKKIGYGRPVVYAKNEGGYNGTEVDLEQLLSWVAENKPDSYMKNVTTKMMRDYT